MIRLLGTSHISPQSVEKIEREVEEEPDCVAVELDPARYESLRSGEEGTYPSLVFRILSWIQRRLGKRTGVFPGEEMLRAVECAQERGVDVYLIDQSIHETVRDFEEVSLWEKLKLFLTSLGLRNPYNFNLEDVPSYDLVDEVIKHLRVNSPKLYEILVEKRNRRMADAVEDLSERYEDILVVVGIGHLPGMKKLLSKKNINFQDKTF